MNRWMTRAGLVCFSWVAMVLAGLGDEKEGEYRLELKSSSMPLQVATTDDSHRKNWFVEVGQFLGDGDRFLVKGYGVSKMLVDGKEKEVPTLQLLDQHTGEMVKLRRGVVSRVKGGKGE